MKTNLFSGEVENTFVLQDLIDMFKIGWRSVESARLPSSMWVSDKNLDGLGASHAESLLRMKAEKIVGMNWKPKSETVILSIVPPEAPANEN